MHSAVFVLVEQIASALAHAHQRIVVESIHRELARVEDEELRHVDLVALGCVDRIALRVLNAELERRFSNVEES